MSGSVREGGKGEGTSKASLLRLASAQQVADSDGGSRGNTEGK